MIPFIRCRVSRLEIGTLIAHPQSRPRQSSKAMAARPARDAIPAENRSPSSPGWRRVQKRVDDLVAASAADVSAGMSELETERAQLQVDAFSLVEPWVNGDMRRSGAGYRLCGSHGAFGRDGWAQASAGGGSLRRAASRPSRFRARRREQSASAAKRVMFLISKVRARRFAVVDADGQACIPLRRFNGPAGT